MAEKPTTPIERIQAEVNELMSSLTIIEQIGPTLKKISAQINELAAEEGKKAVSRGLKKEQP